MHAELIAIGSELVLGEIVDTNSTHIARTLRTIGVEVERFSAIGDNVEQIAALVREAAVRAGIVITTGGLGPTVDDPTREAVARAFGRELEYRPELWQQIEDRFRRFGRAPTENNRQQAYVPAGALPLENPVGTAPCFIVEHAQGVVVSLPGVPREMEHMLSARVLPYLREKFALTGFIKARLLRTVGVGESMIDAEIGEFEKLTNPVVGLAAHAGAVDIRITAKAESEAAADALIAPVEAQVRERLQVKFGDVIYAEGGTTLEETVLQVLAARRHSLAIAEAGAQGRLNARLALLPEAAQVYRGAVALNGTPSLAAVAAQLRTERGAEYGLALSVTVTDEQRKIEVALADAMGVHEHRQTYGGALTNLSQWATTVALNFLRLRLLKD
ncbi:MAG: CinA family nicotinamide mononucleotide deamidase-related protein [Anaerolineales bacterium]